MIETILFVTDRSVRTGDYLHEYHDCAKTYAIIYKYDLTAAEHQTRWVQCPVSLTICLDKGLR
jgi:hypothetical protein